MDRMRPMKKKSMWAGILALTLLVCCVGNPGREKHPGVEKMQQKMGTKHLDKAEFLVKVADFETSPKEWKYLGDKPCIVDFYASWCGPCKMIAPILDSLAEEYAGKIDIYKVDVEKEGDLAAVFGIRSIPSLLFCPKDGKPQMLQGAMGRDEFEKAIGEILLNAH